MTSFDTPDLDALLGPEARRSPAMEALWQWMVEAGATADWTGMPAAAARAAQDNGNRQWNAELPPMQVAEPVALGGVPATLLVPPDARPGRLLFLHGGGWAFGTPDTYARFARLLALDTGLGVVLPHYRLAPEAPFPAGLDDALACWRALAAEAEGPLVVAGDSAGANLALAVTLAEIANGGRRPDAALLFYGVFQPDLETASYRRFADGHGLTRGGMARFFDWYAPSGSATDRADPRVSPGLAPERDIARLPPVFLNAAGLDPLLCDTLDLAGRLRAAGVRHALKVHEGLHHGFMQWSLRLPEARDAIREAAGFLAEVLPAGA